MKKIILSLAMAFSFSTSALAETYKDLKKIAFNEELDMNARWKSFMKMTAMKKNESIVDIRAALSSKTWYMRNAGLVALNSINPELAYDEAKKQLTDPALVVRSAAVDVLVKNTKKTAEVRELLWTELSSKKNKVKSQSLWIRPQIIQHLAENPQNSERDRFLALADETDHEVRAGAEKALLKLQKN